MQGRDFRQLSAVYGSERAGKVAPWSSPEGWQSSVDLRQHLWGFPAAPRFPPGELGSWRAEEVLARGTVN